MRRPTALAFRGAAALAGAVFFAVVVYEARHRLAEPSRGEVVVSVAPRVSTVDQLVRIRVRGAGRHARLAVRASTRDARGRRWLADAVFRADRAGSLDLNEAPSLAGSYRGRDPMGLFWSLRPAGAPGDRAVRPRFVPPRSASVTIAVIRDGTTVAAARIRRRAAAPGVTSRRIDVNEHRFAGVLYRPAARPRRSAVAVLGGSEGGLSGGLSGSYSHRTGT